MTRRGLITRYTLFAVAATLVNLATQRAALALAASLAPGLSLSLAIGAGTLTGLMVKYLLDKHWIFFDRSTGLGMHGRKFLLYAAMGVLTTCIFWGSEALFWVLWRSDAMRELGAVLGLAAGYTAKYNLDRRFVFDRGAPAGSAAS